MFPAVIPAMWLQVARLMEKPRNAKVICLCLVFAFLHYSRSVKRAMMFPEYRCPGKSDGNKQE